MPLDTKLTYLLYKDPCPFLKTAGSFEFKDFCFESIFTAGQVNYVTASVGTVPEINVDWTGREDERKRQLSWWRFVNYC